MSRLFLIAVAAVALFLRWAATGHVVLAVAGATVSIPALLIVAGTVMALATAAAALMLYRIRAEFTPPVRRHPTLMRPVKPEGSRR